MLRTCCTSSAGLTSVVGLYHDWLGRSILIGPSVPVGKRGLPDLAFRVRSLFVDSNVRFLYPRTPAQPKRALPGSDSDSNSVQTNMPGSKCRDARNQVAHREPELASFLSNTPVTSKADHGANAKAL